MDGYDDDDNNGNNDDYPYGQQDEWHADNWDEVSEYQGVYDDQHHWWLDTQDFSDELTARLYAEDVFNGDIVPESIHSGMGDVVHIVLEQLGEDEWVVIAEIYLEYPG